MLGDKGGEKTKCYRLLKSRSAPSLQADDDRGLLAQIIKQPGGEESVGSKDGCNDWRAPAVSFTTVVVVVVWSEGSEVIGLPWKGPVLLKVFPLGSCTLSSISRVSC